MEKILIDALHIEKKRKPTKPSRSSNEKRLQIKNEGKTQSVKVKLDFQVYSLDIFTDIDSFKVYEVSY